MALLAVPLGAHIVANNFHPTAVPLQPTPSSRQIPTPTPSTAQVMTSNRAVLFRAGWWIQLNL